MPKLWDKCGSMTRSRQLTNGALTAVAPFEMEGGGAATTAAVAAGETEVVMDADEANKMRGGTVWERVVSCRLVDTRVGRPTREGNNVAATVFRDKEYEAFKCHDVVWIWPIEVVAGGFMRPHKHSVESVDDDREPIRRHLLTFQAGRHSRQSGGCHSGRGRVRGGGVFYGCV